MDASPPRSTNEMNQCHRRKARLTSFLKKALKPIFALCALAPVLAPQHASATTPPNYFWDANAGTGGTGTWDTTSTNWGTAANTTPTTTWVNGSNTAIFSSSTAGTVTIANGVNITANALTFTVTGYFVTDNAGGGGTGTLTLTGAATITVNPSVTAAIGAVLNDTTTTDSLTFTGGGTVQLSGSNAGAYLGSSVTIAANTTVQAISFAPALPRAAGFVVNGTLDLNGTTLNTIASLAGSNAAAVVTNTDTGAYAILNVGVNSYTGEPTSTSYAGTITDGPTTVETVSGGAGTKPLRALGLTISPPAGASYTLVLTNTGNTYHGLTTVSNGGTAHVAVLQAGAANVFSPNSVVDVGAGGTLDLNGFSQTIAGLSTTTATPDKGTVTNTAASTTATLTVGNTGLAAGVLNALVSNVNLQNGAGGAGVIAFTKIGPYTQVLAGDNTYTGATLVSAGVLTAGSATGFSANSSYTVNGTLDINGYNTTAGSLSGSGEVINGIAGDPDSGGAPATFTTGSNNASTTFGGEITDGNSGKLTLTKTGSGVFTLTGPNNYSGGTNIQQGVLSFSFGSLGTGLVTFTGNSTLQYQPGNTQDTSNPATNGIKIGNGVTATIDTNGNNVTYATAFSGASTGSLTKTGLGTLALTAANIYSGGTNINQGTLDFVNNGLGAGPVTFTGNSTLQWAAGNTQDLSTTQSGPLTINTGVTATFDTNSNNVTLATSLSTGAGSGVTKTGLGVLQLKGTNTYNGATTVNNGTLQAGSTTAFSPNSAFNVLAPGVLDLHGFSNSIGSLAGAGTVTNNGTAGATLTEGGNNTSTTFSGVIQDGTAPTALITTGTGALTLSSPNTYSGGTTINTGSTIFVANPTALGMGNVVNNGILAAVSGSSATNIQVGRSYTQAGSGELDLRIGGTVIGTFDRLSVTGTASVSGRLSVSSLNGFTPKAGASIPVITASSVNGTFGQVAGNLSNLPLLKLTVSYLSNEVLLNFGQGSFVMINNKPITLTPNENAVATALDHVSSSASAKRLVGILDSFPVQALPGAYDMIAPAEYGAVFEISRSAAKMEAASIENRLDEVHAAAFGAGAPGPAGDDKDSKGSKEVMPPPQDRLSVFANGSGEFVNVGDSPNAKGYNFDSGAATVGVDYLFTDHFLAGVLLNYTGSTVDLINNGRLDANAFRGGVYASLFGSGAYVNGFVGGAYSDYDVTRQGLGGTVRGSTSGGDFNALITTGYDFHAGGFTYGPVGSFQYTYSDLDSFNEQGSLVPLHINSGHGDSLLTNLGARATYECHIGSMVLVPEIRATWQHEYGDVFDEVSASMLLGSPAFAVSSSPIGRDSLVLNAGFTLRLTPNMSAYAFYDGELACSNYQTNNLLIGFRVSF